tara:strand:- start:21838 stop:21963 length:126 start_codon:yes stop_codon:yes gene_type:complete
VQSKKKATAERGTVAFSGAMPFIDQASVFWFYTSKSGVNQV